MIDGFCLKTLNNSCGSNSVTENKIKYLFLTSLLTQNKVFNEYKKMYKYIVRIPLFLTILIIFVVEIFS